MTASQRLGTTDKAIAIFRKDKVTGRVLAVFPYNDGQPGTDRVILGYVHERYVQKSTESYGRFIARTAPTAPDEYAQLKTTMDSLGYWFSVDTRRNPHHWSLSADTIGRNTLK